MKVSLKQAKRHLKLFKRWLRPRNKWSSTRHFFKDESVDGGAKDNEGSSKYNIDIPEELKYVLVNISFGFQLVVI